MNGEYLVQQAEAAYQTQDLEQILSLFDPEIVVYWNGQKIVQGIEELRRLHEKWGIRKDFKIKKTLRAVMGDTIAVEWHSSWIDENGKLNEGYGGEFWIMSHNRLKEWHAYYTRYISGNLATASGQPKDS